MSGGPLRGTAGECGAGTDGLRAPGVPVAVAAAPPGRGGAPRGPWAVRASFRPVRLTWLTRLVRLVRLPEGTQVEVRA
jgi:hypothetical protein